MAQVLAQVIYSYKANGANPEVGTHFITIPDDVAGRQLDLAPVEAYPDTDKEGDFETYQILPEIAELIQESFADKMGLIWKIDEIEAIKMDGIPYPRTEKFAFY